MKNLTITLILFISFSTFSQNLYVPDCGMIVREDIVVDSLIFECKTTVLLQDNIILRIKERLVGGNYIHFKYGDKGRDTTKLKSEMTALAHIDEDTGEIHYSYRDVTSVNPKIIFDKCMPERFVYGAYIDFDLNTPICGENALGIKDYYEDKDLKNYKCIVYGLLGQELYKGKFKDIPIVYDRILFIKVFIDNKGIYYIKKMIIN